MELTDLNLIEEKNVTLMSRKTLWRLRRAGQIAYYKRGRRIYYSRQHLLDYLTSIEHPRIAAAFAQRAA